MTKDFRPRHPVRKIHRPDAAQLWFFAESDLGLCFHAQRFGGAPTWQAQRFKHLAPDSITLRLRKELVGWQWTRLDKQPGNAAWRLGFRRPESSVEKYLQVWPSGQALRFALLNSEGEHVAFHRSRPTRETWEPYEPESTPSRPQITASGNDAAMKRLNSRKNKILADMQKLPEAETLERQAKAILGALHLFREGDHSLRTEDPQYPLIDLQGKTPTERAEKLFTRSKKLRKGILHAKRRYRETLAEMERVHDNTTKSTPQGQPAGKGKAKSRLPYKEYTSSTGMLIRVGRSGADNAALLRHHSKPHHWWFHVSGAPGSHVVVLNNRKSACDETTFEEALALAAHHSSLKHQHAVEVEYTQVKHLASLKGHKPGTVTTKRSNTATAADPERRQVIARRLQAPG